MLYKDINLLPNVRKKSTKSSRSFIYVLLVITVLSYVGINFVYNPLAEKKAVEDKIAATRKAIDGYGDVAGQYLDAKQKNNEYLTRTAALKNVLSGAIMSTEVINALLDARPEGIIIQDFTYSTGILSVTVSGDSYETIGKYITNLKKFPSFDKVNYNSISLGKKVLTPEQENSFVTKVFGNLLPNEILTLLSGGSDINIEDYITETYGEDYYAEIRNSVKSELEKEAEIYTLQISITIKDKE